MAHYMLNGRAQHLSLDKEIWTMFKKMGLLFAASVLWTASATAGMIVDTISVNKKLDTGQSTGYTHDINDQGFVLGSAISGDLKIGIKDDKKGWDELLPEIILFTIEDFDFDTGTFTFGQDFNSSLEVQALAALNSDGMLNVTIKSLLGDFWVKDSVLTVITEDGVNVPEPGTLALLGLGLVGLGAARRRKA